MSKLKIFLVIPAILSLILITFGLALAACDNPADGTLKTFTVTFNINEGSGTVPGTISAQSGSSITLPNGGGLTKTGCTFGGWNTRADGTGTNYNAGASYTVTGSITLYARWDAISPLPSDPLAALVGQWHTKTGANIKAFEITSAGTFIMADTTYDVSVSGNTITLTFGGTTVGTFTYAVSNGEMVIINGTGVGESAAASSPVLHYYTITLINGQSVYNRISVRAGSSATLPSINYSAVGGDFFDSWNSNADGTGTRYTGGSSFTPPSNITLYAVWVFSELRFTLINNGAAYSVSANYKAITNVAIPATYNGLPVTAIDNGAFIECTGLTTITIPDSVTSIGRSAFIDCTSLTSIIIPDSVTSIDEMAFIRCTSLTTITIPASVGSIGYQVFAGCISLTNITIPTSVTSFGYGAFENCSSLTSITIPASVTSIDGDSVFRNCTSLTAITVDNSNPNYASEGGVLYNKAKTELIIAPEGIKGSYIIPEGVTFIGGFSGCTGLTAITIPASVTSLVSDAFYDCNSLTNIIINTDKVSAWGTRLPADNLTVTFNANIGADAFYDCTRLISVTIAETVTSIGSSAFRGCTGLTSITIPDSVTSISWGTIYGCTNLTSITLPCDAISNTITSDIKSHITDVTVSGNGAIPRNAFDNCTALERITLGAGITSVSAGDFDGCNALTSIQVDDGNSVYSSVNGVLFNKEKTTLILFPAGLSVSYSIPESVTNIGNGAFLKCTGLTAITIPAGVTSIGNDAFSGCNSLNNIIINTDFTTTYNANWGTRFPADNLTVTFNKDIGDYAFYNCARLTSVTIGDGVTSIGQAAFSGCSGITEITIGAGVNNFWTNTFSGCTNLKRVDVVPANSKYGSVDGILYNKAQSSMLLIPQKVSGAINIPSGVTSIGERAFSGCTGITSITIPASVTSIGAYAFQNCARLTSINFSSANSEYSSIDGVLFSKDKKLLIRYPAGNVRTDYTIPSGVETIESYAFEGCTNLTSVTIPNSPPFIKEETLTNIIIFINGVSTIRRYAFEGCTNLNTVIFTGSDIYDHSTYEDALMWFILGLSADVSNPIAELIDLIGFAVNVFTDGYARGFYDNAFPQGSSGSGGDALKTAYLIGGAGRYTRASGGSSWTKQQ